MRVLVVIPVYNEITTVEGVLRKVRQYASDILVIDDASTDGTGRVLARLKDELSFKLIARQSNVGYGRAIQDGLRAGMEGQYDWVITMDCDEQHEPASIPRFLEVAKMGELDVISGSRYLSLDDADGVPPADRRSINLRITDEINDRLGLCLTDGFCGFKAYRVDAVRDLELTEDGYSFPMQFWVEAVAAGLRIGEIPVRLIYTDAQRSFGGGLDDPALRYRHYQEVLHRAICRRAGQLSCVARTGLGCGCN